MGMHLLVGGMGMVEVPAVVLLGLCSCRDDTLVGRLTWN